jgi:hypothetical protein
MLKKGKIILNNSFGQLLQCCIVVFVFFFLPLCSFGQFSKNDSTRNLAKIKDTISFSDTTLLLNKNDSFSRNSGSLEDRLGIKISEDALDDVVVATAVDSAVMDIKTNNFRLYGDAKVDYDGRKLSAPKIEFNQNTNIASACIVADTSKKDKKPPLFEQGTEKVSYDSLQYNFKSQRAIIHNARSQYGEGFIHSTQIKRNPDKSFYGYRNVYTTCALDHPHFGIRTNRIKIIPEQAIATGSANIEIEGVPTPIFLPFGYFPINNESHRSGFILPGYTTEVNRGLGFLKGGYYLYLNDKVDLQLQTDIFTKGSIAGYLTSNYVNRYRYTGNVFLSYALNKTGEEFDPLAQITKDFAFRWTHNKDAKSLPGVNFNANVNVQSGTFFVNNSFNTNQILQNQFQSNITFAKSWAGKPYTLTLSATHNQNTANKQVNVTLPDVAFFVNARNPFMRKNPVGAAKWYEKVTVGYTMNSLNRITFYDSTFQLSKLQLTDFQNGMRHSIPISANYSILRFVTVSFNIAYNEYWNTLKTQRGYNDVTKRVDTNIERGFAASRDFNGGFALNTQIYGMKLFKKGTIKGFRHTLRPSVGMNYRPDFAKSPFDFYYQARLDSSQRLTYLSPYEQSIIGLPPQGRNGSVSFGLNNNLQMKLRNSKDTTTGYKNIVLLDALDFNTSYNLAADSFNWDFYRFSARTNIANKLNINANANFDPYQWDYTAMRRTPRTTLAARNQFARLTNAQIGFGTSFRSKEKSARKSAEAAKETEDFRSLMRNNGAYNYVDFNIPWTVNLTYAFNLDRRPSSFSLSDSSVITQTITLGGDINFTTRWKVAFNTGYNIVEKQITFSSIDIYRDLHCWEMRLGLIPFGFRKSFNFSLNVKAQVLQDLRILRRRDFRDAVN